MRLSTSMIAGVCAAMMGLGPGCSAGGAESDEIGADNAAQPVQDDGTLLEAPACPASTATNAAHVTAGRARAQTVTFFIWRFTTYTAVGSNDNLGTSGTQRTTLYEISPGVFSSNASRCPTDGGGTGGTSGTGGTTGTGGTPTGGTTGTGGSSTGGTTGTGGSSTGGTAATGGTGGGSTGPLPTALPRATQSCPSLQTGNVSILGREVRVWAGTRTGSPRGPIVVYWHATGSNPLEAPRGLGQAAVNEIVSLGGIVIAPNAYDGRGGQDGTPTTGNNVWYVGDLRVADEAVACAIQQLDIDTRRIHASGFSAGGLQTAAMAYARAGYIASAVPYSGGLGFFSTALQDAAHPPAVAAVHGSDSDVVIINFKTASENFLNDMKRKGGFTVDCNHGGGHTIPSTMPASTWRFMKDHPYGVQPDPYAGGTPSGFASYCRLW